MLSTIPPNWSVPNMSRLLTMKATPARPSSRPNALRQVIRSPSSITAKTAATIGLELMITAARPADTVFSAMKPMPRYKA